MVKERYLKKGSGDRLVLLLLFILLLKIILNNRNNTRHISNLYLYYPKEVGGRITCGVV